MYNKQKPERNKWRENRGRFNDQNKKNRVRFRGREMEEKGGNRERNCGRNSESYTKGKGYTR